MHQPNKDDLNFMNTLFKTGQVAPVIDTYYPLSQVPEAIQYLGEGHACGKIVITMEA